MTVFVEWNPKFEVYEVKQTGGEDVEIRRDTREEAIHAARIYVEGDEDIVVKGPDSSSFTTV